MQPLTYPFYPPYVSTLSPQSLWITAEKVDKSVKKRFSHQEVGKSSEKRVFYISFPKKMFTLHYAILCTTMDLSGSSLHYTMYILYILHRYFLIVFYLQRFFQFLLSSLPAFFVFQGLFSFLYLYIMVLHPFITTLLWQCPSVHGCVFSSFFFALLMWKSLFSADNSFFAAQLYIGISPIILFKNLTLFMCSNLLVRHYYLSCLCLYSLSLCKNKYVS